MIEIGATQFDALAAASHLETDRAIAADLRRTTPLSDRSERELLDLVARAREVAAELDLEEEHRVVAVARLMAIHGDDFHRRDRFARFFRAGRVSPGGRLASLIRSLDEAR